MCCKVIGTHSTWVSSKTYIIRLALSFPSSFSYDYGRNGWVSHKKYVELLLELVSKELNHFGWLQVYSGRLGVIVVLSPA